MFVCHQRHSGRSNKGSVGLLLKPAAVCVPVCGHREVLISFINGWLGQPDAWFC